MKKIYSFLFLFFSYAALFAQGGSVEMPMLVSGFDNNGGVTATVGQVFDAIAPSGSIISTVTEGIQQGELSACEDITEVTDVDNNTYPVVDLGLYCWTGKNMKALRYANTDPIPDVMVHTGSSYSADDILNTFGALYTWSAATQYNDGQGICPDGWHIPTEAEMEYVMATYGSEDLMATTHWIPVGGTDLSQFTLLPGGCYNSVSGYYEDLLVHAYVWTIKEEGTHVVACMFGAACGTSEFVAGEKANGYSVRCVLNY